MGAGKTTLLNNILHSDHGLRVAVLVNDFGEVNIDSELVVGTTGSESISLANGCICCTLREDLLEQVKELADEKKFDYLLIESTGISVSI